MTDPKSWEQSWPDDLKAAIYDEPESIQDDISEWERMLAADDGAETACEAPVGSLEYDCLRWPWGDIKSIEEAFIGRFSKSKILDIDFQDGEPTIFARLAKEASHRLQFPPNTAYLHGIGAFSSAVVVNFRAEFYDSVTATGMYTICAQPTGTSKSSINDVFIGPIHEALEKRTRALAAFHALHANTKLAAQEKLAKAKTEADMRAVYEDIHRADDALRSKPPIGPALKNVTPEAAEMVAERQYGLINIVSDESEALDVAVGGMYQNDGRGKKSNNGVFLAAFDGGRMGVARVGRKGMEGEIRGAFCVLAQDSAVKTIIEKAADGRGVTERCLILREKQIRGWRNHGRRTKDAALYAEYSQLCENVIQGTYPITLRMSDEIQDLLYDIRNHLEPFLRPGSKYSAEQVQGAASKLDKQVVKMAAVMHVAHYWSGKPGVKPSMELDIRFVRKSILICLDLLNSYTTLVEAFSEDASSKQIIDVFRVMQNASKSGKLHTSYDTLRQNIKNFSWYKHLDNKAEYLKNLMARFEELNICAVKETGENKKHWPILINPALATYAPKEE